MRPLVSRTLTGPATTAGGGGGTTPMTPRSTVYTNPAAIPSPLPPGATVSEVLLPSTKSPGGINMDKALTWMKAGQFLYEKGAAGGKDYGKMIDLIGAGAAFAGPVGMAVAAILQVCKGILKLFNIGGVWGNTGPGVHAWITVFGPQSFLDYVRANNLPVFDDLDTTRRCFVAWSVDAWKIPLADGFVTFEISDAMRINDGIDFEQFGTHDPPLVFTAQLRAARPAAGVPDWVPGIYEELGIDYDASVEMRRNGETGFAMLNRGVRVEVDGTDTVDAPGSSDESSVGGIFALAGLGYLLSR